MSRKILNFNTDWLFLPEDIEDAKFADYKNEKFEEINLPHTNKLLPHHYFSEEEYQFVSWYRRPFYLEKDHQNKRILIEFDGVMNVAEVYINGEYVDTHRGGYTSFCFDVSKYVNYGEQNMLAVRVDSTSHEDIPPEGNVVDYLLFGGIYRNVRMEIVDPLYIDWSFLTIEEASTELGVISPQFKIINKYDKKQKINIHLKLLNSDNAEIIDVNYESVLKPGNQIVNLNKIRIKNPELWDINNPYLYTAISEIYTDDKLIDRKQDKIGIRKVEFRDDGKFYLNNNPLKLRGLNRHQMFPYLGNAMPARGQKKDAVILKNELGLNFVRSSHYPADPSFLNKCDEIGLLVMEEIPGWQHIGDQEWKDIAIQNLKEMIIRDRNHPSIFSWGVRINESPDDHDFYQTTNRIARKLDQTRGTCGVRCIRDSEFLEDVFTYNDFEFNREGKIKLPNHKPYMITEYMGHMYPTKSYDSVERLIKHAVKHAKIQDKQYGVSEIAGASGWCAFDYNTHKDFGSGDRVCYHGVCDMYRLPKYAGYFYKSQQEPDINPVVFIARYLIPSFNEDYGDKIIIFSNCEEIGLYIGDEHVATKGPNYIDYSNLPHPPFSFKNCHWWDWGASTVGSIKAIGKIDGKEVARHVLYPFGRAEHIKLSADFKELIADGTDCTRVVVELKDKNEQTLHLAHHPVSFELQGPGRLIGENPFSLEAGRGAVFLQAGRKPGQLKLKASVSGLPEAELKVETKPLSCRIVPTVK